MIVVGQQVTYQGTEALVSLEVPPGGLAARDGHDLVVVADADVVALQLLLVGLGELPCWLPADAACWGLAGSRRAQGVEERTQLAAHLGSGGGGGGVGVGVGVGAVGLAEELEGDVAGEGRPAVRVEGAEAGEAGGERGIVASTHAEPDDLVPARPALGRELVLAVRGGLLDAADHARGDVAQERADADGAVLL